MNALTGCLVFFLILALLVYAWPLLLLLAVIAIIKEKRPTAATVEQL